MFKVSIFLMSSTFLFITFSLQGAWANDFRSCPQNFYSQQAPDYIDSKLIEDTVPLCFDGFATLYSGLSRTPLWSAEHLTRERLYQAEKVTREESFHSESWLPSRMRAQLSDFLGSEYERGLLAPNADMANQSQQYDSFSLANIIPLAPENNRYVLKNLESVTRYLTKQHGEVYVVTGVAFRGSKLYQLNHRVLVPTHTFKALYIPETGEASAYYAPNDDTKRVEVISINELALRSGINVFPVIPSEAKATTIPFPTTVGDILDRGDYTGKSQRDSGESQPDEPFWYRILVEVLRWFIDNFLSK